MCAYQAYDVRVAAPKDSRIAVRLRGEDAALVRAAAAAEGATLTEFAVGAAVARARDVLADRRVFLLDDEAWQAFQEALDRPPQPNPKLERLLTRSSVFDGQ
jgi:uncharacterized protein (DUF1778 family)